MNHQLPWLARFRVLPFFSGLLLAAALAGPLPAQNYLGKPVTVYFRDKSRAPVEGIVTDEVVGEKIRLQIPGGSSWFNLDKIERIEIRKEPRQVFQERAAKCKTVKDWLELARWCAGPLVMLGAERQRCLEEAIRLDPDCAEAREGLGQKKEDDGKWVDAEVYYQKRGMVKGPDGRWLTRAEADKIQAERSGLVRGLAGRERESQGVTWALAKTLKSQNYVLKCDSTETVAKRYSQVLEKLHERYAEVLKDYPQYYTGPSTVYVFRNREEFRTFTLSSAGGFFHPIDRAVRAYHGSFGPTGNTDMVLAHEATHQFQHRIMKEMFAVPLWVIEGMATYFGDGTRIRPEGVQLNVIPRERLQSLQTAIATGHYVPLSTLLRIRKGRGSEWPCYDHGWGVIFWCLQGDNPKFKFGHKGEGKRVWKKYLDHLTKDLKKPFPATHFEDEAKFFTGLLLKETGKTLEQWEEDFKKFITNLPQEPLGKWNGRVWDGAPVKMRFSLPEGLSPVKEEDLRFLSREAAAATSAGAVRLWLHVGDNLDQVPRDALRNFIRSNFYDTEFDPDNKDEEVREDTVNGVIKVYVSAFRGKQARRRESTVRLGVEPRAGAKAAPKEKTGAKEKEKEKDKDKDKDKDDQDKDSAKGQKKSPAASGAAADSGEPAAPAVPEPPTESRVRVALFSTLDRFYLFCLAGPEGPFSKIEPKFDEVLKSVKLDYGLR
jgi:hypothetical protein